MTSRPDQIVFNGYAIQNITGYCITDFADDLFDSDDDEETNETIILRRIQDDVIFTIQCRVFFRCSESRGFRFKFILVDDVKRSDNVPVPYAEYNEGSKFEKMCAKLFKFYPRADNVFPYDPNLFVNKK